MATFPLDTPATVPLNHSRKLHNMNTVTHVPSPNKNGKSDVTWHVYGAAQVPVSVTHTLHAPKNLPARLTGTFLPAVLLTEARRRYFPSQKTPCKPCRPSASPSGTPCKPCTHLVGSQKYRVTFAQTSQPPKKPAAKPEIPYTSSLSCQNRSTSTKEITTKTTAL